MGRKGKFADESNLTDSNISETINGIPTTNYIYNF